MSLAQGAINAGFYAVFYHTFFGKESSIYHWVTAF